eukprot:TRINITY_DN1477_c0_g1_i1.p1 TRINITY_DN1477_c0_g1~~TRINITY_DN1477_c0_g1_i1.p1  ORF type:complete len:615 (-),score=229.79 TRINITY_DN1477_c0_g1_i1:35-1879(-)
MEMFEHKIDEAQRSLGFDPRDFIPVQHHPKEWFGSIVFSIFAWPALLFAGFYYFNKFIGKSMSGGGGFGMSNLVGQGYKFVDSKNVKTRFTDVAGLVEAKTEIMEFVSFLKEPAKYQKLGARIPKGALLVGPPGTGKTLLARATAGEAGVPFFTIAGSDFMEMFVGTGPARVRKLFTAAREQAPSIIFIDEIDTIGASRSSNSHRSRGHDERENTLNQLLVEMDGFSSSENPVIVLAGTNRQQVLDKALLRPGRFDRQIQVGNPDILGRKEIFQVHLKPLILENTTPGHLEEIAKKLAVLTPGFSGADISNVCNEAALIAARGDSLNVTFSHFEQAIERVIGGIEKRSKVLSIEEKTKVAYHEAGHAVVGWFCKHADPLLKVSIVPRGLAALGYAQLLPKDRYLYNEEQLFDRMCVTLGGRIAESIIFNEISTGAQDDLEKVTKLAYQQITVFGFNKKIGTLNFPNYGEEGNHNTLYSNNLKETIDEEVRSLINKAYIQTKQLLTERLNELHKVANRLLEQEVLKTEDMVELLGDRLHGESIKDYQEAAEKMLKEAESRRIDKVHTSPIEEVGVSTNENITTPSTENNVESNTTENKEEVKNNENNNNQEKENK